MKFAKNYYIKFERFRSVCIVHPPATFCGEGIEVPVEDIIYTQNSYLPIVDYSDCNLSIENIGWDIFCRFLKYLAEFLIPAT
ncbi:16306_t:CDS:2 [Funneliformis caledonium]|uniref:16306_t:CDS:1 n=1 Tax=Funneliformis caledonium TaxID=1117310 RepID=A0A9N9BK85_9GLOM|nr:16306_t:CDS:2 [Funneliformis caledonium]